MQSTNTEPSNPTYTFKNIGPVTSATLNLGDLTVIAGKNNTGKTYLVYTLYGFLKTWHSIPSLSELVHRQSGKKRTFPDFTVISKSLIQNGSYEISLTKEALNQQEHDILDSLSKEFNRRMLRQVFSTESEHFGDARIFIRTSISSDDRKLENIVEYTLEKDSKLKITRTNTKINISLRAPSRDIGSRELEFMLTHAYKLAIVKHLFPQPFVLTAERFGISLFYRELDFTKNQIVDLLQKMEREKDQSDYSPFFIIDKAMSRYALPIKDNIDFTRSLPDLKRQQSSIYEERAHEKIKEMMNGYYKTDSDGVRFVSKARRKDKKFDVPLHLASASARGLSDLYFFLRHSVVEDQLLILDEPESHLDTSNQIALARLISRLVNLGIRVLVTTHSDYLIKEINNLIMLGGDFDGKSKFMRKWGYSKDDQLHPNSVKGYVARESLLVECNVDKYGLDMPIFDSTIDNINSVANELVSAIN